MTRFYLACPNCRSHYFSLIKGKKWMGHIVLKCKECKSEWVYFNHKLYTFTEALLGFK